VADIEGQGRFGWICRSPGEFRAAARRLDQVDGLWFDAQQMAETTAQGRSYSHEIGCILKTVQPRGTPALAF
jgi:hypothetical protein